MEVVGLYSLDVMELTAQPVQLVVAAREASEE